MIAAVGFAVALIANALSPRGLSLSRDYFPSPGGAAAGAGSQGGAGATNAAAASDDVVRRLKSQGLNPIGEADAERFFRDPQYDQESIVFVDARDDRHYQDGHVPGAFQFDRYYPEKHLPAILPSCLNASRVVVYCTGGACEDSEFAAVALKEAGVPADRLYVYLGGITEWTAKGLPVEIGARKSGALKGTTP